ncbi:MAG: ParA family protein [Pirellulales bacterium]|nr:ParA family protein [Pirellulales bacterium]
MRPATICLINQKGGCGKSSTCFHLAGAFAQAGLNVLLIDTDPQGSLSRGFFGSELVESLPVEQTVAALLGEGSDLLVNDERLIRPTVFDRISICPCNHHAGPLNTPGPETTGLSQHALAEFTGRQRAFDIILIDCPPNLYRCSWAAMIAAHWVIIPAPPEDFGTQGLRAVHQAIQNAHVLNPRVYCLGHLVTRSDRRLLIHRAYEQRLRELYGDMVLDTVIPEASAFKVAVACRKPIQHHSPKSPASDLTARLSREILDRISVRNGQRHVA